MDDFDPGLMYVQGPVCVQRCPRSSRQVAADDLRPVHAIVVAGRAARPLSTPDEFFDDDELEYDDDDGDDEEDDDLFDDDEDVDDW